LNLADGAIEISDYDPPTPDSETRRVWSDGSENLWIAQWNAGQVARFDPVNESLDVFSLERPDAAVRQLAGRPGELWGVESGTDHLVVFGTKSARVPDMFLLRLENPERQSGANDPVWSVHNFADFEIDAG